MNFGLSSLSFRIDHVQPCISPHREHKRERLLLDATVPRLDQTDIYVGLCQCEHCHALLLVATGHAPEPAEVVWQVII